MSSINCSGHLANTDTRWETISQSVDDRTYAELLSEKYDGEYTEKVQALSDPDLAGNGVRKLSKSRCVNIINLFITPFYNPFVDMYRYSLICHKMWELGIARCQDLFARHRRYWRKQL